MSDWKTINYSMNDKEMLTDFLMGQKQITASYNMYAGECVNEQLRTAFLSILNDEHKIQADLFADMHMNGWHQISQADEQNIRKARQKLSGN